MLEVDNIKNKKFVIGVIVIAIVVISINLITVFMN